MADPRVYVAGHEGLVGSAICRALGATGKTFEFITCPRAFLDLRDGDAVHRFFAAERPTHVYLAAATVGGILDNMQRPADFIRDNLAIALNVIEACRWHGVQKLLYLGSSCIYPREAPQPIHEESLGTGPLEPTNAAYAWAKLAGIAMVKAYREQHGLRGICVMPTNLYGPGDRFDPERGHLVASLMARMHAAKVAGDPTFKAWGTGTARREQLHVDDMARASVMLMDRYDSADIINIGTGVDMTIREIVEAVAHVVGYEGELLFDATKPDGMRRKVLDVSRIAALGWRPEEPFDRGLRETYAWYLAHKETG
jgi:GDP-L-fucose synthase